MNYVSFTDEEKIQMFNQISSYFYERNFGQASKSDIELLMFHFYLEKLISEHQNSDGTIDYRRCSDYIISKELGITQQRVRNLKIKKQLIYPVEFNWQLALTQLTKNARYDAVSKKITLSIPDPNLYYEIENFLDEQGAAIEKTLNRKVLQLRVEYYIELIMQLEPDESRKEIIKQLKKSIKATEKDEHLLDEKNIAKTLISTGIDLTTILANIAAIVDPTTAVWKTLANLISAGA